MSSASQTTDHEEIRRWVEERKGTPSRVKDSREGGLLRIDFGEQEENLEPIEWEDFFSVFEKSDLPSCTRIGLPTANSAGSINSSAEADCMLQMLNPRQIGRVPVSRGSSCICRIHSIGGA